MKDDRFEITPALVLEAYRQGLFPMADDADSSELGWYDPARRGVLPIAGLHVPRRLCNKILKKNPFRVTINRAFGEVIHACALPGPKRQKTWINADIISLYTELHKMGHAHSVEAWEGEHLAGGVYGLALGGAFFGESMFSNRTDASKIALVFLAAHLFHQGFVLFDAQYVNEHLKQFGIEEISRAEYKRRLAKALDLDVQFSSSTTGRGSSSPVPSSGAASSENSVISSETVSRFLQSTTQTL